MTSTELREKRAPLVLRTREMSDKANDANRLFTEEEQTNWEKLGKDYDDLTTRIKQAELLEKREAEQLASIGDADVGKGDLDGSEDRDGGSNRENADERGFTEEDQGDAMLAWCLAGKGMDVPEPLQKASKRCGINHRRSEIDMRLRDDTRQARNEFRALSAVTGSAGGALIAEGFIPNLEIALLQFGHVRELADVRRTSEGNDLPWPSMDDTSNEGVLIGESKTVAEQDLSFKGLVLHAYKYSSKMIKVPSELLEDAAFNLPAIIGTALGERLARIQNNHYTVGDGASKPSGVVTGATSGKTAASDTAFIYDEIIELYHSVDPAYRNAAQWMMHDTILLALKKLKDGEGNYIWRSGDLAKGVPDTIENKAYTINSHMASTLTSSTKIMLFGDFKKYKVREVNSLRLRRLDERYAEADQVAFLAFMRFDGALLDAGTNPMKYLEMGT